MGTDTCSRPHSVGTMIVSTRARMPTKTTMPGATRTMADTAADADIPDVLCSDDLPGPTALAWLQRQGRVRLVDNRTAVSRSLPDAVCPRARTAARLLPRRCVACGLLAFWVWEGGPFPDRLTAICMTRPKTTPPHGVDLVQRLLGPGEELEIGGLHVTSPLRTAVDLACLPGDMFDVRVGAGRFVTFLRHSGLGVRDCLVRLEANSRAVGYSTGRRRLQELDARPEVRILLTPLSASPCPPGRRTVPARPSGRSTGRHPGRTAHAETIP